MRHLVTTDWLSENLDDPNIIVLDASYKPVGGQKPLHEHVQIKGVHFFDIDFFSDQSSSLPHMLASEGEFQDKARKLGINSETHLIIYDNMGIYSAPRAWWMFRIMGHEKVSVLNGGLPRWIADGYEVEEKNETGTTLKEGNFNARLNPTLVKSMAQVKENIATNEFQTIDARSKGRFDGTSPEPRPQLKSGHIPNSMNVPFVDVLENGSFKSEEELEELFQVVDRNKPLTFSCGSGLTACIVMLAAEQVLENEKAVYDGSWTEWASNDNPIDSK